MQKLTNPSGKRGKFGGGLTGNVLNGKKMNLIDEQKDLISIILYKKKIDTTSLMKRWNFVR